jgi:hypothetical protein
LEGGFEFLVACGEAAEVFEAREAAFDAVSFAVESFVEFALAFAIGLGRDYGDCSHGSDVVQDLLAVVALVGHHATGLALSQQVDRLGTVVDLTGGDAEVDRQA